MVLTGKTQAQLDREAVAASVSLEMERLTAELASTDWYVTRQAETGKPAPEDVLAARATARARISELRGNQ